MFPLKFLPAVTAAVLLAAVLPSPAQQVNTEFRIQKVEPTFVESPKFTGPQFDKRSSQKPGPWLEVEVTFEWQPKLKEPKYTEELTANFYILLNNKGQQFPQGALLVGSVNMMSIPQGKDLHTVVFVSPRTLERMFDGKVPANASGSLVDVGVTLSKQGQVVASTSWKSTTGEWWPKLQQTPGYVLNKNETPFAPLAWDYYEAIKPKGAGF